MDLGGAVVLSEGEEDMYKVQVATPGFCSQRFLEAVENGLPLTKDDLLNEDYY